MTNEALNLLSKPWRNFLEKFKEIDGLKVCKWKEVHHLAHITRRYEQLYNVSFALSFKGPPSKCTEIVLVKKMCAMLDTTNPIKIKTYIDWVFDRKIIPHNMRIRSLAYFTAPGLGNEFNLFWKDRNRIQKATELPMEYQVLAVQLDLSISTYGDVAFVHSALEQDSESESRRPYKQFMNGLIALGFDTDVLKEIK